MATAVLGGTDSKLRRVVFLYRTKTYTQYTHETHCKSPNQEVPANILMNNPICNGICEQLNGSQKMITIQSSTSGASTSLDEIEVKIGCRFIPTIDEKYKQR